MTRAPFPRIVLSLGSCALLSACALVMGFDDYDAAQVTTVQTEAKATSVHGTIDGLEGGATAHIRVNGGEEIVRPNGTFVIERALTPGRAFRVEAKSDGYACVTEPAEGSSAPDGDLEANVHCASQNARLAALAFVDGVLTPSFDPGTPHYDLSAPLLRILRGIDGSARPQSENATIAVGPAFVPGARGATLPLTFAAKSLTVRVQPAAGDNNEYVVDRALHATRFKGVSPSPQDSLGFAVAVSGDVLAVGAFLEGGVSGGGACHIFRRTGGVWHEEAVLTPSAFPFNAQFGGSLALRGDVLVVGAPNAGTPGGSGAVFVYRHGSAGWAQEATLTGTGGAYGVSVALADDVLAVGAQTEAVGGAAYVYRHAGSTWTIEARVTATQPTMDVGFGRSVAITADRLVVGAPWDNGRTGAVYVFLRTGTDWALEKELSPYALGEQQAQFGFSTVIENGVIAVGAPGDASTAAGIEADAAPDPTAFAVGAAFVYRLSNDQWTKEAYIKATNAHPVAKFGWSIGLAQETLIVGAPGEKSRALGVDGTPNTDGFQIGAAYVLRRDGAAWSQRAYVKAPLVRDSDEFGKSVATDGTTLVVGVPGESDTAGGVMLDPDASTPDASSSGAAYVY